MRGRLLLIHWNNNEAQMLASPLRDLQWEVVTESLDGARAIQHARANPPDAVVIYLTRLPSHGRETALALRSSNPESTVPLVFVDGSTDTVVSMRKRVPKAIYTTSPALVDVLDDLTQTNA